jgi:2-phospho-L-lactate guanylyltransferase
VSRSLSREKSPKCYGAQADTACLRSTSNNDGGNVDNDMALWAIVPIKPLRNGKSRLAEVLSQDERADLNQRLLVHTLDTLGNISEIDQVLVISRDPAALALARDHGARTVQENGNYELNLALTRATVVAQSYITGSVLILPADLPLLTAEDIRAMMEKASHPPVVVVAPDRHRLGTNALLISPVGLIDYDFGPDSFRRHCQRAIDKGARLEICELPSLALDVDLPEDLAILEEKLESAYE